MALAVGPAVRSHRTRVMHLYRRALKLVTDWGVERDVFYVEHANVRRQFEANRNVSYAEALRLLEEGETRARELHHPDRYIVPVFPGGSKYKRNLPVPPEITVVQDYGREPHTMQ
eukprot:jgi/Chlat1/7156/Chrsp57S06824